MASLFTRIVRGEVPCHKVGENDHYLAFLDINPLREGHTLVVPKIEVDDLFDLDDAVLEGMLPFAKGVARRIRKVVPCARIGVAVIGLEIPHAHIHLVPIDGIHDLDFSRPKLGLSHEALGAIAERVRNA